MEENVKKQCLFGMHPVLEAIRSGKKIEKVLLKKGMDGPQFRELLELLEKDRIHFLKKTGYLTSSSLWKNSTGLSGEYTRGLLHISRI